MNYTKMMLLASILAVPALHAEDSEWVTVGTGIYQEDLATYFNLYEPFIDEGLKWNVEIEESSSTPGYYRFKPYADETPMAEIMGISDEGYLYIHAENPQKVWVEEAWFYDMLFYSHMVEENEWPEENQKDYGALADGCISFSPKSFAIINIYDEDYGYAYTNINGDFKVWLPGHGEIDNDYSIQLEYSFCGENDEIPVNLKAGANVAKVKYLIEPGVTVTEENPLSLAHVASEGTEIKPGEHKIKCPARGVYTLSFVTLDADGALMKGKAVNIYGVSDDSEWKSLGTTEYNESFVAGYYEELDEVELMVELQESVATPGLYRLVNPYANHPANTFEAHEGHDHYIYIHAEDPGFVYIENTPVGADFGFGDGHVTSSVTKALEEGYSLEEIKEAEIEHGIIDEDGIIRFPDWGLWYGDRDWFDGYFTATGEHFRVKIPGYSGIDSIAADSSATPEYYNLQGIRLAKKPSKGLFIEKTGADAKLKF